MEYAFSLVLFAPDAVQKAVADVVQRAEGALVGEVFERAEGGGAPLVGFSGFQLLGVDGSFAC